MVIRILQESNSDTAALTTTVTAGSVLHVYTICDDTHTATVADSLNGTYGAALDTIQDTTNHDTLTQFRFENSLGGSNTITVTSAGSAFINVWLIEIAGAKTSSALDGHTGQLQAAPGTGTDAVTSGNASSANQPALVVGLSYNSTNAVPPAAGTVFTSTLLGLAAEGRSEYKRVTATGNQAATFTATNGSDRYLTMVAVYDERLSPTINTQPANVTVPQGQTTTFTVSATISSGGGSLTYQWKKNAVDIGSATSSSYTTPTLDMTFNKALYTCNVTDNNGTTLTDYAILTVLPAASVFRLKA